MAIVASGQVRTCSPVVACSSAPEPFSKGRFTDKAHSPYMFKIGRFSEMLQLHAQVEGMLAAVAAAASTQPGGGGSGAASQSTPGKAAPPKWNQSAELLARRRRRAWALQVC